MTEEEKLEPTLLDKAMAVTPVTPSNVRTYTREDATLSLAWLVEDVSIGAVAKAKGLEKGSSTLTYLAYSLRHAHRLGMIRAGAERLSTDEETQED